MTNSNRPRIFRRMTTLALSAVMAATCLTAVPSVASAADSIGIIDDADGKFYPIESDGAVSKEWDGSIASSFAGGTGTESNPYLISNGSELAYLAQQVNAGSNFDGQCFKLTMDILLNDDVDDEPTTWTRIGNNNKSFQGTFDGANHKVIGLYINDTSNSYYQGLFGYNAGTIKNVNLTDSRMVCGGNFVGGICGYNNGIISNCYSATKITSSNASNYYGGVCGYNTGTMSNCTNKGELYLTGGNSSYNKENIGGVAGGNNGIIDSSCNIGRIYTTAYSKNVGGVCGLNAGTISSSYNNGEVNGRLYTGGVCGENYEGTVKDSYNTGSVTGRYRYTGGVCGYSGSSNSSDVILRCYNTGDVTNTYSSNDSGFTGGICSKLNGYLIRLCYNTGAVNGSSCSTAGICGEIIAGEVKECYNSGSVASTKNHTGGIVGYLNSNCVIENCYNTGSISGTSWIGGIWATSTSTNTMTNCYNIGKVSGTGSEIYPVGYNKGQISNVYYDSETSKANNSTNSSWARTTEQLTAKTAISDLGFDASKWSKKSNTAVYWFYPDIKGIDNDQPRAVAAAPVPTGLKAAAGNKSVTLTWDNMEGAEKYAVYKYEGSRSTCLSDNVTGTKYSVTGLTNETKYGFAVKSYAGGKWSDLCKVVYATPTAVTKPVILAYKAGEGKVKLEWKALSGAEMYRVYYYLGGKYTRAFTADGSRTVATVTGLTGGTRYGFVVSAKVNGVWTDFSNVKDLVYVTPIAVKPVILAVKAGDNKVKVQWQPVTGAEMYRVYYYLNGKYTRAFTTDADRVIATVSNLNGKTKYGFVVSAKVNGAWTSYTDAADLVYATPTGAVKPFIIGCKPGSGKVKLEWQAVPKAEMYRVYYYLNGKYTRAFTANGSRTIATVSGLNNGTTYAFIVSAKVNGTWTDYTNSSEFVYAKPNA